MTKVSSHIIWPGLDATWTQSTFRKMRCLTVAYRRRR